MQVETPLLSRNEKPLAYNQGGHGSVRYCQELRVIGHRQIPLGQNRVENYSGVTLPWVWWTVNINIGVSHIQIICIAITLIQYEITPVYVIIPVCLSLRMAKEVSKLVLKRSGKLIKEDNFFLTCLVHRPLSCIDLDLWMEFGIEQAVQGWLQSQSDQCVWGDGFPTFLVRSLPSCS